jgi:hypothetical protein
MVILGLFVHYGRKEDPNVQQLAMMRTVVTFVLFGGTFLSQILSGTLLFNAQYNPSYAYSWITFRCSSIGLGIVMMIWIFQSPAYQQRMDFVFLAKNKKIYGLIILCTFFNPILIATLPWIHSQITEVTLGFPTFKLFYICTFLTVTESVILTAIYASFAVEERNLLSQSALEQFDFFFSVIFTFLNGFVMLLECFFVGNVTGRIEDRPRKMVVDELSVIVEMTSVQSPLQSDLEARSHEQPPTVNQQFGERIKILERTEGLLLERIKILEDEKEQRSSQLDCILEKLKVLEGYYQHFETERSKLVQTDVDNEKNLMDRIQLLEKEKQETAQTMTLLMERIQALETSRPV